MRVNFDSEITRMDLIDGDVLTTSTDEHGNQSTVSSFVDGILPQMMSGPYIGCFDEMDFVRPDVSYVMQRVLEDKGLMITEDGGLSLHLTRCSACSQLAIRWVKVTSSGCIREQDHTACVPR